VRVNTWQAWQQLWRRRMLSSPQLSFLSDQLSESTGSEKVPAQPQNRLPTVNALKPHLSCFPSFCPATLPYDEMANQTAMVLA